VAIAQHVAQAGVVAGPEDRGELFGRTGHVANRGEDLLPFGTAEVLFHGRKGGSDDVVMMDVRTDGLDGVEPDAMNQIEIAGCERRWMRAEVKRGGPHAPA